jgi:hypothetical protein
MKIDNVNTVAKNFRDDNSNIINNNVLLNLKFVYIVINRAQGGNWRITKSSVE